MNPSKVLLLDVDGVIFNHPRALERVGKRITKVVHKMLPGKPTALEAHHINRRLYTSYGHTLLGLRAIYQNKIPSIAQFNKDIYNLETIEYLYAIRNSYEVEEKKIEFMSVLEHASKKDVPVYLFSNAPIHWCQGIIDIMDMHDAVPQDNILSSSHPVFQDTLLKPMPSLYSSVQDFLEHTYKNNELQICYVDDAWINIMPVIGEPGWQPIYMNRELGGCIQSKKVQTVQTLREIEMIV